MRLFILKKRPKGGINAVGPFGTRPATRARQELLMRAVCEGLEARRLLTATWTVTNTNDTGTGSLRQAILNANSQGTGSNDNIVFNIPIAGNSYNSSYDAFTISPKSQLPAITDKNLTIDGRTETEWNSSISNPAGGPVIFLNGGGQSIAGLYITAAGDVIANMGIDSFAGTTPVSGGVLISGDNVGNDVVKGCWIGLGPNGTSAAGNGIGIADEYDPNGYETINSGTSGTDPDYIGNNTIGIQLAGGGNDVVNDAILGSTYGGGAAAPNGTGIEIYGDSHNTISNSYIYYSTGDGVDIENDGSTGSASNTLTGNAILHNAGNGVSISGSGTTNNILTSNFIQSNSGIGVSISSSASATLVGLSVLTEPSPSSSANTIVLNGAAGVNIASTAGTQNDIFGDYIGTDASSLALGNAHEGVIIFGNYEDVSGCVISANGYSGISLLGNDNGVGECYLGTNVAGTAALGNGHEGLYINGNDNNVTYDTIGGNTYTGVTITDASGLTGLDDGMLQDYIGTNAAGTAIPNQQQGVLVSGSDADILGAVISDNDEQGISLGGSGSFLSGDQITANGIGGIYVDGSNDTIGQSGDPANTIDSNTAGTGYGIEFDTASATNDLVANNLIGTNSAGASGLGNTAGVIVQNGAYDITIGGTAAGAANVISGNGDDGGVTIAGPSNNVTVEGNLIGTNPAGTASLANAADGVVIYDSSNNTIGGTTTTGRNIISGNQSYGVYLNDYGTGNLVEENYIGTNAAGTAAVPNGGGVEIYQASSDFITGNLISGNARDGVDVVGLATTGSGSASQIANNLIGTDFTGLNPLGNGGFGITVELDDTEVGANTIDYNSLCGIFAGQNGDGGPSIDGCTVYDNLQGGIINAAVTTVYDCTVTGNGVNDGSSAYAISPGGIYTTGTILVADSTIDMNTSNLSGNAGGVTVGSGTAELENCIVAQNIGGDALGAVSSSSDYNLIGDGTGLTGISNGINSNQIGTDTAPINPLLGPLANNGGGIETMAPESTSPALGAGIGISGFYSDERGVSRPTSGAVDIGAVERAFLSESITSSSVYLRLDPNGQTLNVYYNNTGTGTPAVTYLLSDISSLSVTGAAAGNSQLTVDFSAGTPIPTGSFNYNGQGTGNTLEIIGGAGTNEMRIEAASFFFGSSAGYYADVQNHIVDPRVSTGPLVIGSHQVVSLPVAPAGGGFVTRTFSSLILNVGSKLIVPTASVGTDRQLLVVQSATINAGATLDLGGNDADFTNTPLATVTNWVTSGFNGGAWAGTGITSSFAAGTTAHLTGLGVIQNNQGGSPVFGASRLFDGIVPGASDVLVKYTYYGDANLDGQVDGSDYSLIDNGFNNHLTGWYNGDFDFSSTVNGSDYTLIDNAFNTQGASLAAQIAAVAKPSTGSGAAIPGSIFSQIHVTTNDEPPASSAGLAASLIDQLRKKATTTGTGNQGFGASN